ncbi:MAG: universal stress protein [Acidobacteriia bacterium]|nr:universal stress protein [Terriglobia bacterium]
MKALEVKQQIALKNILFATDFEASAGRALPFAVALADRYGAKFYAAHVIPPGAYALARPESVELTLEELQAHASRALNQIIDPLRQHGQRCGTLLGCGDVPDVLMEFVRNHAVDLVVVGTSSRGGLGKVLLGSTAEDIIRVAPCPVLTVGPHVTASVGVCSIVCATDFSLGSLRAAEFAVSLAHKFRADLTLVHVVDEALTESPDLAIRRTEQRLREMIPSEPNLLYEPKVVVEIGPVAERILAVANELIADVIVMGVRGAGAFADTVSHFGSIAHRVVAIASCPVMTVGDPRKAEDE